MPRRPAPRAPPFARDRDRIIHTSASFRAPEGRSRKFSSPHEGDHFRTRLTHSLEVAQVARSIATALRLNSDLAETVALGHDLGHPPFGHAGEEEHWRRRMVRSFGGFDHNACIASASSPGWSGRPPKAFDGLNLTWETSWRVVVNGHNGPVHRHVLDARPAWREIAAYDRGYDLGLATWPSAEAQVAALSHDNAKNNHDVDDEVLRGRTASASGRAAGHAL